MKQRVQRTERVRGNITVPGDKSISHRAGMLAAIAEGTTQIRNFSSSEDCATTLKCLVELGIEVKRDGDYVVIAGRPGGFATPTAALDCGNSGTTIRLISGLLAGIGIEATLTGDESLRSRPMGRVITPLEKMGAVIESSDGKAPLHLVGGQRLAGIEYELPVASAQVKSCVLLAGLSAEGSTSVIETTPTRDHTERMLRGFGVEVDVSALGPGRKISVRGGSRLKATDLTVPGDVSSAAFFLVAAAILPGSDVTITDVGLNPTRSAIFDVLKAYGVELQITNQRVSAGEPIGDIRVRSSQPPVRPADYTIRGEMVANLIDEVPVLAVLGACSEGGLEIRDAGELRVKESDRIASIVTNLRAMSAEVEEFEDGFRIEKSELKGGRVDSFGDHRIAMAFAVAGLAAEGETVIENAECAAVSFPTFFKVLGSLAE
ncbi:MAG: 3-phosphoshikimate 1-carboxyvinyltransferase [Acidobacteria bacterium]|nr:3-phosphoshikimate 1-carboxyvinyltransferase [Acidobacteriota bacterium]